MEEQNIFKDKNLSDILEDIYTTSVAKRIKIDGFIGKMQSLVKDAADAQALMPIMKDLLDVSVKNDELIIKMLSAVQKGKPTTPTAGDYGLTEADKKELLDSLKNVDAESKEVDKELKSVEERIK